eukprot:Pompholyxophrys_punicea_v1_NODE_834_length_1230_cov_13.220426.p1 type:complete len:283 gc:universal NODE_834_length_1230_cov_13.220426:869-21(-)
MNEAESEKEKGNEFFNQKQFSEAIEHYSNGIDKLKNLEINEEIRNFLVTLYSNRAESHLQLKNFKEALENAESALQLNKSHAKSINRLKRARDSLENQDLVIPEDAGPIFDVVYIPSDTNRPVEVVHVPQPPGKEVECLMDFAKAHFRKGGMSAEAAETIRSNVHKQLAESGKNLSELDPEIVNRLAQSEWVDVVPLLINKKSTQFIGVNLYADDAAGPKKLEKNYRAMDIAQLCGIQRDILGDVFIGKVFDNEENFRRLHFRLNDLSSDSSWIKLARQSKK